MFTFYVDRLPPNYGGIAYGPVVLILEKYRHDTGLHAHEQVHVRQSWRGLFIAHALCYLFSPRYKLACEVEDFCS